MKTTVGIFYFHKSINNRNPIKRLNHLFEFQNMFFFAYISRPLNNTLSTWNRTHSTHVFALYAKPRDNRTKRTLKPRRYDAAPRHQSAMLMHTLSECIWVGAICLRLFFWYAHKAGSDQRVTFRLKLGAHAASEFVSHRPRQTDTHRERGHSNDTYRITIEK